MQLQLQRPSQHCRTRLNSSSYLVQLLPSFPDSLTKRYAYADSQVGDGATEKPSHFTPSFAPIKAKAETALLSLQSTHRSLRPYSVRPGFVDISDQPDLAKLVPPRPAPFIKKLIPVLGPLWRAIYPSGTAPTKELAKVLTDLGMGDGGIVKGAGVVGEGRILTNVGMRRLAKVKQHTEV